MTLTVGSNLGLLANGALGEAHYTELMRQWRGFDALIMPSVKSRVASLPASGNVDGDRYIVTSDNRIARWTTYLSSAQWEYFTPKAGWETYSVADDKKYRYTPAGGWAEVLAGGGGGDGGFDNPMTAIGDLIVGSTAGAPTRLGKGSTGQVLTVGASGALEWATPTGGGGGGPAVEVYQTAAPNGSGTLDLSAVGTTIWGVNLTANATSVTLPTGITGAKGLSVIATQDSTGGRTMAWPASITWHGGVAPAINLAPNAKTILSLLTVDGGTSWIGIPISAANAMVAPFKFAPYTLATMPPAASHPLGIITVTDATGGAKVCMSNGTNWCLLNTATTVS